MLAGWAASRCQPEDSWVQWVDQWETGWAVSMMLAPHPRPYPGLKVEGRDRACPHNCPLGTWVTSVLRQQASIEPLQLLTGRKAKSSLLGLLLGYTWNVPANNGHQCWKLEEGAPARTLGEGRTQEGMCRGGPRTQGQQRCRSSPAPMA